MSPRCGLIEESSLREYGGSLREYGGVAPLELGILDCGVVESGFHFRFWVIVWGFIIRG